MCHQILEVVVVGQVEANCYIFGSSKEKEAALIDPGADYEKILATLQDLGDLELKYIINTHGHIDHIGSNHKFKAPILIHNLDKDFLSDPEKNLSAWCGAPYRSPGAERLLNEGDEIQLGEITLSVIHTPGHTPGGICLKHNGLIFTGDTLFKGGVGRSDFPYGSEVELIASIKEKLLVYDDGTLIYPGHGESSTIGRERKENPFL